MASGLCARAVVSEGTAKTHVHHVYKKLNVHSQQELMALIDSVEV